jgi:hypothetical protein
LLGILEARGLGPSYLGRRFLLIFFKS